MQSFWFARYFSVLKTVVFWLQNCNSTVYSYRRKFLFQFCLMSSWFERKIDHFSAVNATSESKNYLFLCRYLLSSFITVFSLLGDRGGWIRTIYGKNKDLWKKDCDKLYSYRKHVFCRAKQNTLLDKMVTDDYKRPHYYVDDPYEPYHKRPEFLWTRTKPLPPSKNVYKYLDD